MGLEGSAGDDTITVTRQLLDLGHNAVAALSRHPDGANGLGGCTTARSCNAAGGDSAIGADGTACALDHLPHHGFADHAVIDDVLFADAQQADLHLVGITHDSALEVIATASNAGDLVGNVAAGATLGRGEGQPFLAQAIAQNLGQSLVAVGNDVAAQSIERYLP